MKIGWIGLGHMGLPMSHRVAAGGHSISAYVRNDKGRLRAIERGYQPVESFKDVCSGADVVISSVFDDASLTDIVTSRGGLGQHLAATQVFIDTSTVSPAVSASISMKLAESGCAYLRVPVSGSVTMAEAGSLTAMISGPEKAATRVDPLIAAFASKRFYLGPAEQARYMKLAINAMVGAMAPLLGEALSVSLHGGVTLDKAVDVFSQSAIAMPLLDYKRETIVTDNYDPAFSVAGMLKDMNLVLSTANPGRSIPLLDQIRAEYSRRVGEGDGELDFFVLLKRKLESAAC